MGAKLTRVSAARRSIGERVHLEQQRRPRTLFADSDFSLGRQERIRPASAPAAAASTAHRDVPTSVLYNPL